MKKVAISLFIVVAASTLFSVVSCVDQEDKKISVPFLPELVDVTTDAQQKLNQQLFKAVDSSTITEVKQLLDAGANVNAKEGMFQDTVLEHAMNHLKVDMVRFLVDAGANVNIASNFGFESLLYYALERYLCDDLNRKSREKLQSPFLSSSSFEIPISNEEKYHKEQAELAKLHAKKEIALSIAQKADPNIFKIERDPLYAPILCVHDIPPLSICARYNNVEFAKILLDRGANPNNKDSIGQTALHNCASVGNELTKMLIDSGADKDAIDHEQNTPLHYAVMMMNYEAVQLLVEAGAKINVINARGKSPYSIAQANVKVYTDDSLLFEDSLRRSTEIANFLACNGAK
jgi:ankyrin repeat protein